jgi:hypothetical protein
MWWRERLSTGKRKMEMEKLNTEERELTINELDSASGGFLWMPAIVPGLVLAAALRSGVEALLRRF